MFSSTTEAIKFAYLDTDLHILPRWGGKIPRAEIRAPNEEVLFACQKQQINDKAIFTLLNEIPRYFVKFHTVE